MTLSPTPADLRALLDDAAKAWSAFADARGKMNAARPDPILATPAERALYDERYQADHKAERAHWSAAIKLAQQAPALLDHIAALEQRAAELEALSRDESDG